MVETSLLTMWCPVYSRRESYLGFRMELGNLFEDAKGKRSSGRNRKAEIPILRPGADHLVVCAEQRIVREG